MSNGDLVTDVGNNLYQSVDEVTVSLTDSDKISSLQEEYNLRPEIYNDILQQAEKATSEANGQANVTIFVSSPETSTTKSSGGITINAAMPDEYDTWNGESFLHQQVYYNNLFLNGTVASGSSAMDVANDVKTYAMYAYDLSGASSKIVDKISIFSSGYDVLQAVFGFLNADLITGSYKDSFTVSVDYNVCTKYTYVKINGTYRLGARTQKVRLNDVSTELYYVDDAGGHRKAASQVQNRLIHTPHFNSPYSIAHEYAHAGGDYFSELAQYEIYYKRFNFGY
ncbi:MAG: DUF5022 domain-containing protein [Intestinibacillus sp.]